MASAQQPSPNDSSPYDAEAEHELFDLANQARAQAGIAPLQMDDGLTQAARAHAAVMAGQRQLSHQFAGEPSLAQRLAANCTLHLDRAGENVSAAGNVEQSHQGLMHSPPHRENLLNPATTWLDSGWCVPEIRSMSRRILDIVCQPIRLGKLEAWSAEASPECGGRPICLSCSGWTATPPRALPAPWRAPIP